MTSPTGQPVPRPEVFDEMLQVLQKKDTLALTPPIVDALRDVYRQTVGDFLERTAGQGPQGDYWSDVEVRDFVMTQSLQIARRARAGGGSVDAVRKAARDVIDEARHEYCGTLPGGTGAKARSGTAMSPLEAARRIGGFCPSFQK